MLRLTNSIRRRDWLRLGALAPFGLSAHSLFANRAAAEDTTQQQRSSFGRAKQCVILFMAGGPAQQDTFDMKPDAPADYRSAFRPIDTTASGIQICEHFPHLAQQMDKIAMVR